MLSWFLSLIVGMLFEFNEKTAVINYVHKLEQAKLELPKADICASFETWVVDELVEKTIKATKDSGFNKIVVAGGVSANKKLREELAKHAKENNIECYVPKMEYCTDNAAMVGGIGFHSFKKGEFISHDADSFARLPGIVRVPFL